MIDLSKEKLELNYPCNWIYKVVVLTEKDAKAAVKEVLDSREYKMTKSKTSSKGKFISFSVETLVHNEDDRVELYEQLRTHARIKMVI